MATVKLGGNATIGDVLSTLDRAEDYLCGVLRNMHRFQKDHGAAFVRVGTTGSGKSPHYRIEPDTDPLSFFDDVRDGGNVNAHFIAFDGRNHEIKSDWGMKELRNKNWSGDFMGYEAVQALLGNLRSGTRKRNR